MHNANMGEFPFNLHVGSAACNSTNFKVSASRTVRFGKSQQTLQHRAGISELAPRALPLAGQGLAPLSKATS